MLNTNTLILSRSIGSLMLAVAFLLIQSTAFASDQDVERHVLTERGGIIFSSGDDASVVIQEGRITATEGRSIKLFPGTHIKSGEQLIFSIVSKEHHEQLAEEAAQEKREKTAASILARSDEVPVAPESGTMFRNLHPTSGSSAVIGQQLAAIAVMPVRTQSSQVAHTAVLHKHIPFFNIHNHHAVTFRPVYVPDLSWGKRAESIGVMLA